MEKKLQQLDLEDLREIEQAINQRLAAQKSWRAKLSLRREYIVMALVGFVASLLHPAAPILAIVGLVGLRNRQYLTIPALRLAVVATVSFLVAVSIAVQGPVHAWPLLTLSITGLLTSISMTSIYLLRGGARITISA